MVSCPPRTAGTQKFPLDSGYIKTLVSGAVNERSSRVSIRPVLLVDGPEDASTSTLLPFLPDVNSLRTNPGFSTCDRDSFFFSPSILLLELSRQVYFSRLASFSTISLCISPAEVEQPPCHALVLIYVPSLLSKITGMVSLNRTRNPRLKPQQQQQQKESGE